uniref:Uncharacterized protein n=1 Tax=Plectus sambesii TaxID=2011161 RepID=A0A914UL56_9BILA
MLNDSIDDDISIETRSVELLDWHMLGTLLSDHAVQEAGCETDSTGSYDSYEEGYARNSQSRHSSPMGGSFDRAALILSHMNEQDRNTLLAPVNQGLVDPKSVFYLKDASGTQEIAICVEDLLYLVAQQWGTDEDVKLLVGAEELIDGSVPVRLADAIRRMSVNTDSCETVYSVIDNGSSGYSSGPETRPSRVNSECATFISSSASNDAIFPRVPSSRPPSSSISMVFNRMHRQSKVLRWSLRSGHRGRLQSVVTVPRMMPLAVDDRAAFVLASRAINRIVDQFIELYSASPSADDFLEKYLRNRFVAIELAAEYSRLMESLRIATTDELEQRTANATNNETAAAIKSFLEAEERWDNFLKSVDEELNAGMNSMDAEEVLGQEAGDIRLVDSKSRLEGRLKDFLHPVFGRYTLVCMLRFFGCPACLSHIMLLNERRAEFEDNLCNIVMVMLRFFGCPACLSHIMLLNERRAEFEDNLCNIVMVSRGTAVAGSRWLKLAGINFPLLLDAHLNFVEALEFKRSAYALSSSQLSRKFGQMARGGDCLELSTLVDDSRHDIYQLGGHVLLDSNGRMVFALKCASFDDWPTPDRLLELISQAVIDDRMNRMRSDSRRSRFASDADGKQPLVRPARTSTNAGLVPPQDIYRKRSCTVL